MDAVRHIGECERTLAEMRSLLCAVEAADRAESVLERLHELVPHARLRCLPAVISLGQLVQAARESILSHQYLQAAAIAGYASQLTEALLTPGCRPDDDRMEEVEQLCEKTATFAPPSEESPAGALVFLRSLMGGEYGTLASRLLTELEIDLAGRRRFLEWLSRNHVPVDEARQAVSDYSWDGAIDHYHQRALAHLPPVITEQLARLSSIAEELQCNI